MHSYKLVRYQQLSRQDLTSDPWSLILSLLSPFIYNSCHRISKMHWRNGNLQRLESNFQSVWHVHAIVYCVAAVLPKVKNQSHRWAQDLWRALVQSSPQRRHSHISLLTALSRAFTYRASPRTEIPQLFWALVPLFTHLHRDIFLR